MVRKTISLPKTAGTKEDRIVEILYTGGTTKFPKAVPITYDLFLECVEEQLDVSTPLIPKEENAILAGAPLFHILGQACELATLCFGGTLILQRKVNLDGMLETIQRFKSKTFVGVPALYRMILEHDRVDFYNLQSLQYCFCAGDVLPVEIGTRGSPEDIRVRNDALIALAEKHPEVLPIATVHPYDGQAALDELARVAARGVKVLKLHSHTQKSDVADPRVLALARKAGELGVIVLMDNANIVPGENEKLFNLAVRAPKTRFVFAHMGAANFRFWNILPLARTADGFGMDNVYFDISGAVLLAADSPIEQEFVWTLRNVGIDHVILGSDYPQMSLARTMGAFEKIDLTDEEKAKIRVGNARKLIGPVTGCGDFTDHSPLELQLQPLRSKRSHHPRADTPA